MRISPFFDGSMLYFKASIDPVSVNYIPKHVPSSTLLRDLAKF